MIKKALIILLLSSAIWFAIGMIFFYYQHKYFSAEEAIKLFKPIGVICLIFIICLLIRYIVRKIKQQNKH